MQIRSPILVLVVLVSSFLNLKQIHAQAGTVASAICEAAFVRVRKFDRLPTPLKMHDRYIGEERGLFIDPITKEPWNVRYFTRLERDSLRVIQRDGLFYDAKGKKLDSEFDAESLTFEEALLVVSKSYHIYFFPRDVRGEIHHSSILAGGDVMFAGMAAFSDGRLRVLTDRSGHYTPTPEHMRWFVRLLHRSGADLSMMTLMGHAAMYYSKSQAMRPREIRETLLDYSQRTP